MSKKPTSQMPYTVENELTPMGEEVLAVADRLEAWLALAPEGPISLDSGAARGIVKAFVDGWGSTMLRGLAARPMSLTELDRRIADFSYPALERRLSSMRMARLIEPHPSSSGSGRPYALTDWARRGVVPLAAAADCEGRNLRDAAPPVTRIDIEAAFLLATPLVGLGPRTSGSCRLEVEAAPGHVAEGAGVGVTVERGRVVACDSELEVADAYARGPAASWFGAIVDGTASLLSFGGSRRIPEAMVMGLHAALLGC